MRISRHTRWIAAVPVAVLLGLLGVGDTCAAPGQVSFTPSHVDFGIQLIVPGSAEVAGTPFPGLYVTVDGVSQSDGTVVATRVEVTGIAFSGRVRTLAAGAWQVDETLLVVKVSKEGRKVLEQLVRDSDLEGVKIIATVSQDIDLDDRVSTLWGLFTRFDCARDIVFTETTLVGPVARPSGRMGIDATWKPGYPEPLDMTDDIREKVNVRWSEYGI